MDHTKLRQVHEHLSKIPLGLIVFNSGDKREEYILYNDYQYYVLINEIKKSDFESIDEWMATKLTVLGDLQPLMPEKTYTSLSKEDIEYLNNMKAKNTYLVVNLK
jgi:hypothetical protein